MSILLVLVTNPDWYTEKDADSAEQYLVQVWTGMRKKTKAKTFDFLREEIYSNSAAGLENLPPTSSVIRGHILKGAFLVNKACTLLGNSNHEQEDYKKTLEYGWEEQFGVMLPSKYLKFLPSIFTTICKCSRKCRTKRCRCRLAGVKCTTFCHGLAEACCDNSH